MPILLLLAATGIQAGEFLSKIPTGFHLQTFDSLPASGTIDSPHNFSSGSYSYSASAPGILFTAKFGSNVVLSTNAADDPITFTFTSGNVTAVGGYFWNTDVGFGVVPGDIALAVSDGTTVTASSAGSGSFFGFYSDQPIGWLRVTPASDQYATVDNLYLGEHLGIPEPATMAGVFGGLLALIALRRRLRQ